MRLRGCFGIDKAGWGNPRNLVWSSGSILGAPEEEIRGGRAVDSMSSWLLKVLVEMSTNSPIEKASPGFLPRNLVTNSGALNCSLVSR